MSQAWPHALNAWDPCINALSFAQRNQYLAAQAQFQFRHGAPSITQGGTVERETADWHCRSS
jgi:hypothetical protein